MPQKMSMQTPQDLFVHELSDMLSAEQIIVQTLSEGQQFVQDSQIRQGMQKHQQESEQQAQNIQQALQILGEQPHPVTCHAAAGLRQSLMDVVQSQPSPEVLEGALLGGMAKTEHLEIAGYTGLIKKAQAMGQTDIAQLLQQNLQQEQNMLQQVEKIADQKTQQMAAMSQGRETVVATR